MYKITKGKDHSKGIKAVIYGVEGIGKTTLAAKFPDALFIDTEGSTGCYEDIARLPKPEGWKDLLAMVDWVAKEKPCKTLVIDTFDWAEMAEVDDMLVENKWKSIESAGYGKGYILSSERIAKFLKDMEVKLIDQGLNVVLNCHAQRVKEELPEESGRFDRYELKLGQKTGSRTSPLVKEWADMVLFCNYKTFVEKSDKGANAKAIGGTERVMYATHSAVWDAKNRFNLPDEMPMSFKPLAKIFAGQPGTAPKADPVASKPTPVPAPAVENVQPKAEVKTEVKPVESKPEAPEVINPCFPDCIPDAVVKICSDHGYQADDLFTMVRDNITRNPASFVSFEQVPGKFWSAFVSDFEEKYQILMEEARRDNLPF